MSDPQDATPASAPARSVTGFAVVALFGLFAWLGWVAGAWLHTSCIWVGSFMVTPIPSVVIKPVNAAQAFTATAYNSLAATCSLAFSSASSSLHGAFVSLPSTAFSSLADTAKTLTIALLNTSIRIVTSGYSRVHHLVMKMAAVLFSNLIGHVMIVKATSNHILVSMLMTAKLGLEQLWTWALLLLWRGFTIVALAAVIVYWYEIQVSSPCACLHCLHFC